MTTIGLVRVLSGSLAVGRRSGGETQKTTVRWRDKRAQGALRSGGCFCLGISGASHLVPPTGNVPQWFKYLVSLVSSHIAEASHER
jgi:hypothetical protein